MLRYVLRRLLGAALVVFAVFTLSFVIMRVSPGSPFDEERELPAEVVANQARTTGMARPVAIDSAVILVEVLVDKNESVASGQPYARVLVGGQPTQLIAE
ncbi:MAG: hypothetical protein VX223_09680, partial [Myxococcota bacterium]|nr:hypothetical protein [Myxococcota bacterium]